MKILNIGPLELVFVLVLMILLLGPQGMKRAIWHIAKWIREARQSMLWKDIRAFIHEAQALPTQLVREAGFDEHVDEIRRTTKVSIDLNEQPARLPGEVRSPGSKRLRPPQRVGGYDSNRTHSNNGEATETPTATPTPTE